MLQILRGRMLAGRLHAGATRNCTRSDKAKHRLIDDVLLKVRAIMDSLLGVLKRREPCSLGAASITRFRKRHAGTRAPNAHLVGVKQRELP